MSAAVSMEEASAELVIAMQGLGLEIAEHGSIELWQEMWRVVHILKRYSDRLPECQQVLNELGQLELNSL